MGSLFYVQLVRKVQLVTSDRKISGSSPGAVVVLCTASARESPHLLSDKPVLMDDGMCSRRNCVS